MNKIKFLGVLLLFVCLALVTVTQVRIQGVDGILAAEQELARSSWPFPSATPAVDVSFVISHQAYRALFAPFIGP